MLPSPSAVTHSPLCPPLNTTKFASGYALLMWAMFGTSRVSIGSEEFLVPPNDVLIVPAGLGQQVLMGDSAVLVPIRYLGVLPNSLRRPLRSHVLGSERQTLLYAFLQQLSYLKSDHSGLPDLLQVIVGRAQPMDDPSSSFQLPRVRAGQLRVVTNYLEADLHAHVDVTELAATVGLSPRTLQRRFSEETGMSLGLWRQHQRVGASIDLLERGYDSTVVANLVGFESASGFYRSFRKITGTSPKQYSVTRTVEAEATRTREAETQEDRAQEQVLDTMSIHIPAQATWRRVNGKHVALWIYRGSAEIRIGPRTHHLKRGDVLLLPAGIPNVVKVHANSLVVPVGFGEPNAINLKSAESSPGSIGVHEEAFLLRCVVGAYTHLRAVGQSSADGFDYVYRKTGGDRGPDSPQHRGVSDLVVRLTRNPVDGSVLAGWAAKLRVDQESLRRAIESATGMSFSQWKMTVKMTRARELLARGDSASMVARSTGYAHLPGLSRAFQQTHGQSLLEYSSDPLLHCDWRREGVQSR